MVLPFASHKYMNCPQKKEMTEDSLNKNIVIQTIAWRLGFCQGTTACNVETTVKTVKPVQFTNLLCVQHDA